MIRCHLTHLASHIARTEGFETCSVLPLRAIADRLASHIARTEGFEMSVAAFWGATFAGQGEPAIGPRNQN